jgi:hypothetical protein
MIDKNLPSRGSLNYDLYIDEEQNFYKIGANYTDCFDYDAFKDKVKNGQEIEIGIKKHNSIIEFSDLRVVTSIIANGHDYFRVNCANEVIHN